MCLGYVKDDIIPLGSKLSKATMDDAKKQLEVMYYKVGIVFHTEEDRNRTECTLGRSVVLILKETGRVLFPLSDNARFLEEYEVLNPRRVKFQFEECWKELNSMLKPVK